MRHSFVIIDEFYDDPDAVRAHALSRPYATIAGVNYPGLTAETEQDVAPLIQRMAHVLGGFSARYYPSQGDFRVTLAVHESARGSMVHLDSTDYSGLVHLSKTPVEGTYFYRHKRLGLDYVTPADEGRPDVIDALVRDTLDPAAWEIVLEIPWKYNRLVLLDGKHFHSGARRFEGTTLADGRLTQNFFFDRASSPDRRRAAAPSLNVQA